MARRCNTPKGTLTEYVNNKWRNGLKIPYSHTSRSNFNVNQDKCLAETFGQCGRKTEFWHFRGSKMTWHFVPLGPIFYHPPKVVATILKSKFNVNLEETFPKKKPKTFILTYLGPIWGKNMAHKGYFSLKPERTHNVAVNQVSWSHNKNFLRKLTKT